MVLKKSHIKAQLIRSYLKKRILVQGVGRTGFQTAGIRRYFKDLKTGPNTRIGPKDFFETAYRLAQLTIMAAVVTMLTVPALAWDGSQVLEPGLNAGTVLLFEDFERDDFDADWPTYWGSAPGPDTVTSPVFAGSRALFLQGRAGEHYSENGGAYTPYTEAGEGVDKAHMRVYLYLEDGFTMGACNQLKLIAIKGGASITDTYGGAGTPPTGYDKMSSLIGIDTDMQLHFYTYHMDQRGIYGDVEYFDMGGGGIASLETGRWVALEIMVQLNTPGAADGEISAWVDGVLRGEVKNLRFREVEDVRIRKFTIVGYFGGAGPQNTSPVDQKMYYDNVVIATEYIGQADGGTSEPTPDDGGSDSDNSGQNGDGSSNGPGCFITLLP